MSSRLLTSLLLLLAVEYSGVLLAVIADLVSGVRRARREGHPCTSRGLRRTVAKVSSYFLALFCLTVIDSMIVASVVVLSACGSVNLSPFPWLTTLGSASLVLIEAKSITENSPHRSRIIEALRLFAGLVKRCRDLRN